MLKKISYETRIGILVFIAVALLVLGYNWLKGTDIFTRYNTFYASYDDLDGISVSSPIRINGYLIGHVGNVYFQPGRQPKIIARLLIRKDVPVWRNSTARIVSADIFGTKVIQLVYSNDTQLAQDNDTLKSDAQEDLASSVSRELLPVKIKTEKLVGSLDSLVTSIRAAINQSTINDIHNSITNINNTLEHLNTVSGKLSDNMSSVNGIIDNVKSITQNIKNNDKTINTILQNFSSVSDSLRKAHFAQVINQLHVTLDTLNASLDKVNKGQGSLGLLVNDKKLYNNLESTTHDLDDLLKDIKAHPGKWLNISIFGRRQD